MRVGPQSKRNLSIAAALILFIYSSLIHVLHSRRTKYYVQSPPATEVVRKENLTVVTSLFNIGRSAIDGRNFEDYISWLEETIVNVKNGGMLVFAEPDTVSIVESKIRKKSVLFRRLHHQDLWLWNQTGKVASILQGPFGASLLHPHDVTNLLPSYSIIQFSKFQFLLMAIEENPFMSSYFYWVDAGFSRHFIGGTANKFSVLPACRPGTIQIEGNLNAFAIQKGEKNLHENEYIGSNECIVKGGVFGGDIDSVRRLSYGALHIFLDHMIGQTMVDNEQIALALLLQESPEMFCILQSNRAYAWEWWGWLQHLK